MKKRNFMLLLVIALGFTLIACGQKENDIATGYEGSNTEKTDNALSLEEENDITLSLIDAEAGDTVYFGRYEQDNDTSNGKEEIAWRVLSSEVIAGYKQMYLLSESILDLQQYNEQYWVSWEHTSLRTWLNDTFLYSAFTEEEIALISTTHPSGDTRGRIGLLTESQVGKYFANREECEAKPTMYAKARADALEHTVFDWWLEEEPGRQDESEKVVHYGGKITPGSLYDTIGYYSVNVYGGVRPSLRIWFEIKQD